MFYVYVLYSIEYNKIYIGYTKDISRRLISHNDPRNKGWTSRYRPWEVIHSETFHSKKEALLKEKKLKSSQGRRFIRNIVEEKKKGG